MNSTKNKECCDERKISSEAKGKSDKIPRIFPTVPVIPKYQRPQSTFASFLMPIECQSSEEDEKLLHLSMELKKNRSNANAIHDIIANLKSSLLELNRNLEKNKK
ncbi:unnamed protein product [Chironomus riparius]|uniref:Uncharacterized protein n=1 Tax=Chironomus riparius TaxID=315576 RepID=A0A9N9RQX5_9DIPT|nr:unnamed protein product [Chironomus riparius]